jgi:hypothetical protein
MQTFQPSLVVNKREKFVKMLNAMRSIGERERVEVKIQYYICTSKGHTYCDKKCATVSVLNYTVC